MSFKQKSTKLEKCDKCDYTSDRQGNVKRHMEEVKHVREPSQRTKYRHFSKLRSDLNSRIKSKENPATVFGEEEVKKLLEDCNSSTRELLKVIKWMRLCFGRQMFAPKISTMISEHLNMINLIQVELRQLS